MLRKFSLYFFANFISKGIAFVALIYITKYLSPAEYGKLSYFLSLSNLIIALTMLGLPNLILTDYISKTQDSQHQIENKILTHIFIVSILVLSVSIFYYNYFNSIFYFLFGIFIIGNFFNQLELNILRIKNYIKKLSYILIGTSIISLFLIYFMIEDFKINIVILSMSFVGILFLFSNLKRSIHYYKFSYPNIDDFKVAIPFMITSFVMVSYYFIDKYFLSHFLGDEFLGIYEIAFKFGNLYDIFIAQVIATIWMPIFYKKLENNQVLTMKLQLEYVYYIILSSFFILLIPDFIWNLPLFFINNDYSDSMQYIKYIFFTFILFQAISFLNMYYMYIKKTYIITIVLAITIVIKSLINYFFIEQYEIFTVIIANILSLSIALTIFLIIYQKELKGNK
jgi:O-antigen/teichoic acid export membrane protein